VEVDQMDHLQHVLAFVGVSTAAVASFHQCRKAKKKSADHEQLWGNEREGTLKAILESDIEHFKKVSFWWYVFFWGAVSAALAELIDYYIFIWPIADKI
jgi:hypothetical protein